MALYTVVVFAVAVSALYIYFTRTFNYWKDKNVTGPKPMPFFGNVFKSAFRYAPIGQVIKNIYETYPTKKVVGVFRMTTPCLLLRDLDIVEHVLIKDFDNFVERDIDFSKEGLGENLFHTNGETWRALRSRFSPIFTKQKLKSMMYLLTDRAEKFVDYVSEITEDTPEHDAHGLVHKYTMSTISACAFGLDIDTFRGDIEVLKKMDKALFTRNFAAELDMMFPGLLQKLNMSLFPGIMKNFLKDLVETVITQRNGVPSASEDFVDLILEYQKELPVASILEITNNMIDVQAFAFYAGGYETTAISISFMLYHLALEPKIQARLRKEIDEYLQRHDDRIELVTLNELIYLNQVLSETLRMYPTVETLQRKVQNDYQCPGTHVKVAKEQMVLISVMGIHRDAKYYPDPDMFNPDNFTPDNVASRHSCAYLPFGLGPRHCIGMRFAQIQSQVCMIRLLSKFQVEASGNTVRTFSFDPYRVVLTPNKKLYIKIVQRKDL